MNQLSLQEKLKLIESSASMADLPISALPPSHKENYYFISYSHKDYKLVFQDILRFEEMGINIWYDSEMHIGENWREIAQMYISKFQCKGVIFYLTENSISSPACNEEVEYVLTHNKTYFSINKAIGGAPVESGYAMLKRMMEGGFQGSQTLLENFSKAFSDEILFLPYESNVDTKVKQILSIKGEELLCVEKAFAFHNEKAAMVTRCRDSSILTVDLTKKYDVDGEGDYRNITEIGDCAFTNCFKLQSVKMSPTIKTIYSNAFRNCASLIDIDLSFVEKIADNAFDGCSSLKISELFASVGKNAFLNVPLTRVFYKAKKPKLNDRSFSLNKSLEEFHIESPFYSSLGNSVFDGCENLKTVGPFFTAPIAERETRDLIKVGSACFSGCNSLKEITFKGDWDFSEAGSLFAWSENLRVINAEIVGAVIPKNFAMKCKNLEKITNSSHYTEVQDSAFEGCESLKTFDLSSVTKVGEKAFFEAGVSEANLINVLSVGEKAFACSKIEKLTIGENCAEIKDGAFAYCNSLKTVKILSRKLNELVWLDRMFSNNVIQVLYLKCYAYNKILTQCDFPKLRLVYIDEQVYQGDFERASFAETKSDVKGYRKFYNTEVPIDYVADEDVDWQSDEVNQADPDRPKYSMNDPNALVGREIIIKHLRAHEPKQYFVEQAVTLAKQKNAVDYLIVSIHRGKSFKLDGTLIENLSFAKLESVLGADTAGGLSIPQLPENLEGKLLRIAVNGEIYMGACARAEIVPPLYYNNAFDSVALLSGGSRAIIQSLIIFDDELLMRAFSGRDIESFAVFNDEFEVTHHFKRDLILNPFR